MTALEHTPAEIIRRLLLTLGHGTDPDTGSGEWLLFHNQMPEAQDKEICVYNTQPIDQGKTMQGDKHLRRGISISVRARGSNESITKAELIAVSLDTISRSYVTIGATTYLVHAIQHNGVISAGRGQQDTRYLSTINCTAPITKVPYGTGA